MLLAGALLAAGCASYRLGNTLPPGIETVYVPTVVNQTGEPLLEPDVTRAIVQEVQRDGTLRIAEAAAADTRLDVTLVTFQLSPVRFERDSTKTATEYRMRIVADITLYKSSDDTVLVQQRVDGEQTFDFLGDMASSKIEILPKTSRDLAHHVIESIVEYW